MKKLFGISFIIILFDRVLKILAQKFLGNTKIYIINNFFYLIFTKNNGAAFSMMSGRQFTLILIALLALIYIIYYIKKYNVKNIGYSFLVGGIIGNLLDRMIYGYVIDFIGIDIFKYHFPIFNIADIFIVVGAFFILLVGEKNEVSSW